MQKPLPWADLYSPTDIATYLDVTPETVRRWVRTGRLRSIQAGRQYRIRQADLAHFLRTETDGTNERQP
jgi:excisionase family DNA binding protein